MGTEFGVWVLLVVVVKRGLRGFEGEIKNLVSLKAVEMVHA